MSKTISLNELENFLNTLLDAGNFEENAYNGVQIQTTVPIEKVATVVSISQEVIQNAMDENVQALVAHHGIFCKGVPPKPEDKSPALF